MILSVFPVKELNKFSGHPCQIFPSYLPFPRGACPGPRPVQDPPELGWGCVHPVRSGAARLLPTDPSFSSPLLSRVRTYLAGPRARGGHGPRSSFPGSGRIPCRPAAPRQEPGPAPALDRPIAR